MLLKTPKGFDPESIVMQAIRDESPAYGGNIRANTANGPATKRFNTCRFTLRNLDSSGPGARRSSSGRRGPGVTWGAHAKIMGRIFNACPEAILVTALTTYRGKDDFEHRHADTYSHKVGINAKMNPIAFGSL